jgi:hypothetical protein
MSKNSSLKGQLLSNKASLPGKSIRQKALLRSVKDQRVSFAEAVDSARLIPKSMVAEFKIVAWPDE